MKKLKKKKYQLDSIFYVRDFLMNLDKNLKNEFRNKKVERRGKKDNYCKKKLQQNILVKIGLIMI